jgi:hypothetical protein
MRGDKAMSETTDLGSHYLARGDDLEPDVYPMLGTLSAAFMLQALPHPLKPLSPPELG